MAIPYRGPNGLDRSGVIPGYRIRMAVTNLEEEVYRIGRALIETAGRHRPQPWEGEWWYQRLLRWAVEDEVFKVQLLRFIDVFPMLRDAEAVAVHLRDYFGEEAVDRLPLRLGTTFATSGVTRGLMARVVARSVRTVGHRFIAGRTAQEALPVLRRLHRQGYAFTLDLLGEATLSEAEAKAYQGRYLELIETLAEEARRWPPNPRLDQAPWGAVPRLNISIKLTSLYSQFDPIAPEATSARVRERLRPILRRAIAAGAFVNIDMEQYEHRDLTLRILRDLLVEPEFAAYPHVGAALQAYLYDTARDIDSLALFAQQRGTPIAVRLVKGAYWDEERIVHA
ncbi:MAG TPA: proline dehydrogenase family protein, partial [Dehalococcoidia bacterium]|nr:proline dehydrogenase family protein [Dehalococcoidia bacterium]